MMKSKTIKPKSHIFISCEQCNKNFQIYPYEIGRARFCSASCRSSWVAMTYKVGLTRIGKEPWNKGKTGVYSSETLMKISMASKGRISPMKGKKAPWATGENSSSKRLEVRRKLSITKIGNKNPQFRHFDELSPVYKGNEAGYHAKHKWIYDRVKKEFLCKSCEREGFTHWANYSGNYKREIEDYLELCPTCHSAFDRNRQLFL